MSNHRGRPRNSTFQDEPAELRIAGNENNPVVQDGAPNIEGLTIDLNEYSYNRDLNERGTSRQGGADNGNGAIDIDDVTFNNSTIATDDVGHDVTRLYTICEEASNRQGEAGNRRNSLAASIQSVDVMSSTWDAIREWLAAHPMPGERAVAATYQGQFMTTALHIVCKLQSPPTDIVQDLIDCAPETVAWADSNDWLPLHLACAFGASYDVLSLLVQAYPEGRVAQDKRRRTPLHFAFGATRSEETASDINSGDGNDESMDGNGICDIVRLLSDSGAARLSDGTGKLPIHYACAYGTNAAALEVLVDAYPNSISAKEHSGRTPLHLAMVNAHRSASLSVLGFLLSVRGTDIINIPDNSGNLPLHLLATSNKLSPDKVVERRSVTECLRMYLAARPKPSADFLTALQALPPWLCDQAVVSPHVQQILNDKIIKRFPTCFLLLDGYSIIALIIVFTISTNEFIRKKYEEGCDCTIPGDGPNDVPLAPIVCLQNDVSLTPVVCLFIISVYFLLREIMQMISLASLGTFSSWVKDAKNWLDLVVIGLAVALGIIMITASCDPNISDTAFRYIVAICKAVFWVAFIVWLKSLRIEFAVFVSGVLYVVQSLKSFLVAVLLVLFAFSQMFFMIYYGSNICPQHSTVVLPVAEACDHSTMTGSFRRVYRMMLGEVGDAYMVYENKRIALVFFVLYALCVVLVLSNVLIVLVIDSYGVIKNERAAIVFWTNRLDFVFEMDAILRVIKRTLNFFKKSKTNPKSLAELEQSLDSTPTDLSSTPAKEKAPFSSAWKSLMSLWDTEGIDDGFWCYFFFRFIAVFIIPVWLLSGVVTVGILWPPEIRSKLLVQSHLGVTQSDIAKELTRNIKELRNEVSTLRTELKEEVKNDYKDIMKLQSELNAARTSIMTGIHQMNHMMTVLLDNAREQNRVPELQAARSGEY
mmetsp:Transcript_15428/g.22553  ORF Transcript_15428/g.22553 Transcript_15428/m.22553 type:complete len:931 (+) Transcript_15428:124-2916(+)